MTRIGALLGIYAGPMQISLTRAPTGWTFPRRS